ncbi:MAG: low molecular weight protein arginine phosphatase [Clostridia bacterium]|nr:low molecular weight protein arginine phosphatase [Clostridia bacterium]
MNILFVCTGNTCRSPMAEGLLKALIQEDDNILVLSGAISTAEGMPASENAIAVMEELDIDLREHISRNIDADVLNEADLVLTMTEGHREAILHYFGDDFEFKTQPLLDFVGIGGDVSDPYGGSIETYRRCRDQLKEAVKLLYKKVTEDDTF